MWDWLIDSTRHRRGVSLTISYVDVDKRETPLIGQGPAHCGLYGEVGHCLMEGQQRLYRTGEGALRTNNTPYCF